MVEMIGIAAHTAMITASLMGAMVEAMEGTEVATVVTTEEITEEVIILTEEPATTKATIPIMEVIIILNTRGTSVYSHHLT